MDGNKVEGSKTSLAGHLRTERFSSNRVKFRGDHQDKIAVVRATNGRSDGPLT